MIIAGTRGHNRDAESSKLAHIPQMNFTERCFTNYKNNFPMLFDSNIYVSTDQIVGEPVGNG